MRLHGYFRSAASWRVRIALALKGLTADNVFHHLRRGEQRAPDYLKLNPQGFVPALELDDGTVLTQSLAIVEWLDESYAQPPLLPGDALGRAKVRAMAQVLAKVRAMDRTEEQVQAWAADVNASGLEACEALVGAGPFCFGAAPGLADICLVPQLGNARRFGVAVERFPRLLAAEAACMALPAFVGAVPGKQPDAE